MRAVLRVYVPVIFSKIVKKGFVVKSLDEISKWKLKYPDKQTPPSEVAIVEGLSDLANITPASKAVKASVAVGTAVVKSTQESEWVRDIIKVRQYEIVEIENAVRFNDTGEVVSYDKSKVIEGKVFETRDIIRREEKFFNDRFDPNNPSAISIIEDKYAPKI